MESCFNIFSLANFEERGEAGKERLGLMSESMAPGLEVFVIYIFLAVFLLGTSVWEGCLIRVGGWL